MKDEPEGRKRRRRAPEPAVPAADPRKLKADEIKTLELEPMTVMLKALLAGQEVKAETPAEKKTKAELLRDIAYATEKGYQIEIPKV